jgi:uncharacterized protein
MHHYKIMRMRLLLVAVLSLSGAAAAAGFDCAGAATATEKTICADAGLSDLDYWLGRYYQGASMALRENASCLAADQREWLRRRERCREAGCLKALYRERLGEFAGLQPGINTRRKLELPEVPSLAWAMAPEADRIVAPPIASRPAVVEGTLLYAQARNSFVLRSGEGVDYILLPDIMRGGANADALPSLAADATSRYSARGRLAVKDDGHPAFDHRHCIFIHRLP